MALAFLQLHHILGLVGGVILLASLLLYFIPAGKLKIPAVVASTFGGIMVGLTLGILLMAMFGYQTRPLNELDVGPLHVAQGGPIDFKLPSRLPAPVNLETPNPKSQLLHLIHALEAVTTPPSKLILSPQVKSVIAGHLKSLLDTERISDAYARQKYITLMTYLDKERTKLEKAGINEQIANEDQLLISVANPYREGDVGMKVILILERLTNREAK